MKISQSGIDLIKSAEGVKYKMYYCPANKPTIGVGHVILPHEKELMTKTLTESEVEDLLKKDLIIFETGVLKLVNVKLTQGQFDALVSFSFNLGLGALKKSTLLSYVNENKMREAALEFQKWNKAGGKVLTGLVKRRAAEKKLFESI